MRLHPGVLALLVGVGCASQAPPIPGPASDAVADGPIGSDAGAEGPASSADGLPPSPVLTLPEESGGTRLQIRRWETADGVGAHFSYWDTTLAGACVWRPAEDGRYRCMRSDTALDGPPLFSDSQCQHPVVRLHRRTCGDAPAYVVTETGYATCPGSYASFKLGAVLETQSYYTGDPSGACSMTASSLPASGWDLFTIESVPTSTFVAGTARLDSKPGALAPVFVDGDDGSSFLLGFRDLINGFDCDFGEATDGTVRCLPTALGQVQGGVYADATCRTTLAIGPRSSCATAQAFIERIGGDACKGAVIAIFKAGTRVDAFTRGPACVPAPLGSDYLTVGDAVPPAHFVLGTLGLVADSRRLRRVGLTSPAGTFGGGLWDSRWGSFCHALVAADGVERCIPFSGTIASASAFSDPACTRPLFPDSETASCGSPHALMEDASVCPARHRLYSVSSEGYTGPVYGRSGGTCVARPAPGGVVLHAQLDEIDPRELVELQQISR
jgi:hypothetical protein